jgi:hypothetical protein
LSWAECVGGDGNGRVGFGARASPGRRGEKERWKLGTHVLTMHKTYITSPFASCTTTIARSNHGLLLLHYAASPTTRILFCKYPALSCKVTGTYNHSKSTPATATLRGSVVSLHPRRRNKRKRPDSTKSIAPHPHGRRLKWEVVRLWMRYRRPAKAYQHCGPRLFCPRLSLHVPKGA